MKKQLIIVLALVLLIPSMVLSGPKLKKTIKDNCSSDGDEKEGDFLLSTLGVMAFDTLSDDQQARTHSLLPQNTITGNDPCVLAIFDMEGVDSFFVPLSILMAQSTQIKVHFKGASWLCLIDQDSVDPATLYNELNQPESTGTLDGRRQRAQALLDMIDS